MKINTEKYLENFKYTYSFKTNDLHTDMDEVLEAVDVLYRRDGKKPPAIHFHKNPDDFRNAAIGKVLQGKKRVFGGTGSSINSFYTKALEDFHSWLGSPRVCFGTLLQQKRTKDLWEYCRVKFGLDTSKFNMKINAGKYPGEAPEYVYAALVLHLNLWHAQALESGFHVLEPPLNVITEGSEQLHSLERPAITFADGTFAWFVEGHRIDPRWYDLSNTTAGEIVVNPNLIERAAVCHWFGWERIAEALGVFVLEDSRNAQWGKLVEIWLPLTGPVRCLDCMCPTGRRMVIPVSDRCETVNAAQEYINGGIPAWMLLNAERRT